MVTQSRSVCLGFTKHYYDLTGQCTVLIVYNASIYVYCVINK